MVSLRTGAAFPPWRPSDGGGGRGWFRSNCCKWPAWPVPQQHRIHQRLAVFWTHFVGHPPKRAQLPTAISSPAPADSDRPHRPGAVGGPPPSATCHSEAVTDRPGYNARCCAAGDARNTGDRAVLFSRDTFCANSAKGGNEKRPHASLVATPLRLPHRRGSTSKSNHTPHCVLTCGGVWWAGASSRALATCSPPSTNNSAQTIRSQHISTRERGSQRLQKLAK